MAIHFHAGMSFIDVAPKNSSCLMSSLRTRCETVQKRNRMVAAESKALIILTI